VPVPKLGMLKLPPPLSNNPPARTVKMTTDGDFGS